jgi:hypothetical protein
VPRHCGWLTWFFQSNPKNMPPLSKKCQAVGKIPPPRFPFDTVRLAAKKPSPIQFGSKNNLIDCVAIK